MIAQRQELQHRAVRAKAELQAERAHADCVDCLFQAEGENATSPMLRDVAIHITAMKPTVVNPEDLDAAVVGATESRNGLVAASCP